MTFKKALCILASTLLLSGCELFVRGDSTDSSSQQSSSSSSSSEQSSSKDSSSKDSSSEESSSSSSKESSSREESSSESKSSESSSSSETSSETSESTSSEGPYEPIVATYPRKVYIDKSTSYNLNLYKMYDWGDAYYVSFKEFYEGIYARILFSGYTDFFTLTTESYDSGVFQLSNDLCDTITIDANNETLYFSNSIDFAVLPFDRTIGDIEYIANGYETAYCKINSGSVNHVAPRSSLTLNYKPYNIDIIAYDGAAYFPFQSMFDLFFAPLSYRFAYNGKDVYLTNGFQDKILTEPTTLEYKYYNDSPWKNKTSRDAKLAEYTYNQMCFHLDFEFGLKEHRGITNFDTFISSHSGLKARLMSTDTDVYEKALIQFFDEYLCDGHTGYGQVSPFRASSNYLDYKIARLLANDRYAKLSQDQSDLSKARKAASKDIGLSVSGNTAIIRFDSFMKASNTDSLIVNLDERSYEELQDTDTYLLFRKAFYEIEENPTIENVVFDVTVNGGGMVDALPYLEAFMTDRPFITMKNTITGEISTVKYEIDLNRNGSFNEPGDTFKNAYNYFVMTSNFSFSCGNAFPTFVKAGNMATIIGETSGGGACAVGYMSTASGSLLQISSHNCFGTYSGSVFTDNDDGVTPDYTFSRSKFYNDEQIALFVNSLIA